MEKIKIQIMVITLAAILVLACGCVQEKPAESPQKEDSSAVSADKLSSTSSAGASTVNTQKETKKYEFTEQKEYNLFEYVISEGVGISLVSINGKLAYCAQDEGKWLIVYDGQEIGKENGSNDRPSTPLQVNGKLTYTVNDYGIRSYIVYDGQEIGKEYDSAFGPAEVNGKLAYIGKKGSDFFIVYGGQEIGKGKGYDSVGGVQDVNGKLAYIATTKQDGRFIVYDGQEMCRGCFKNSLDDFYFKGINGKIAVFYSKSNNGYARSYIWYDGQTLGDEYDNVQSPRQVNGKLAYVAYKGSKSYIIFDGREIGKEYESASEPLEVDGKLAYLASEYNKAKDKGFIFIVYEGQEIGKENEYTGIGSPITVNGKLAYIGIEETQNRTLKSFIVSDGQEIGKEYVSASSPIEVNGKLAFVAVKPSGKMVAVIEK